MLGRARWLWFLAVVWLVIFLTPLRSRLQLLWRGGPQTRFTVIPSPYPVNYWPALAGQNPQSAALQFMGIAAATDAFDHTVSSDDFAKIDQLIQQHPKAAWLPALRLRLTLSSFQTNRVGGELSDVNLLDNLKAGRPSPEISPNQHRNFSGQDLAAALKICRLGEAQEPQNSYYNWIQSCLLWMSWQDQSARQALHEGALKSGWNDHLNDFYTALTQGYQQAMGRPLSASEKMGISDDAPIYRAFGHYREAARIITWSAIKDRRGDNNARALQTLSDLHHLMYLDGRGSEHKIDFLVSYGIMALSSGGAYHANRTELLARINEPPLTMKKKQQLTLQHFVALANQEHRPDLAHQITFEEETRISTFQKVMTAAQQDTSGVPNYLSSSATTGAGGFGVILLLSLLGSILVLIFIAAGKYFLTKDISSAQLEQPRIVEIIQGALAGGGVTAISAAIVLAAMINIVIEAGENTVLAVANVFVVILVLLLVFVLAKNTSLLFHRVRSKNSDKLLWPAISLLLSIAAIVIIAALWPYNYLWMSNHFPLYASLGDPYYAQPPFIQTMATFFALSSGPPFDPDIYSWRIIVAAIPLVFGGLFFLSKTVKRQAQLSNTAIRKKSLFRIFAVLLARALFLAVLLTLWGLAAGIDQSDFLFLALLVIAVTLLTVGWIWFHRPYRRASLQFGLQLFSSSLQLWMCIASTCILAMLLIQLSVNKPLQQEADGKLYGDMNTFQKIVH